MKAVGPFSIGKSKKIMLWKFNNQNELEANLNFLALNGAEQKDIQKLVTSYLPIKRCKIASLQIANTCEEQFGYPIFYVNPKQWVMRYGVVCPPVDNAVDPIQKGEWGTKIFYATLN